MEKERPTLYELSRDFWNFCFENPDLAKPNEIALYFFILEHNNRLGWKTKFGLPASMAMEALSIKSPNTYNKALNNLVDWGFINMVSKSKNQWSSCVVAVLKFKSARKSALDTALIQHVSRHEYGSDSIDKQIYKYTNIQERENAHEKNSFENLFIIPINYLEEYMLSDEKWIEDIARINKLGLTYESSILKAKEWISLFIEKLRADNVKEWSKSDCFRYCNSWIKTELEKLKNNGQKFNKSIKAGIKESEYDGSYAKKRPITSAI